MGLHPETEQRMHELFDGRQCCQCGRPAARLAGGRFYCPDHFPYRQVKVPGSRLAPKPASEPQA